MSSGTVTEDTPVIDTGFVCVLCLKVFDRSQLHYQKSFFILSYLQPRH